MSRMHSFRWRMEAARDLLTPLSKKPTSRVPHSVLVLTSCRIDVGRYFVSYPSGG